MEKPEDEFDSNVTVILLSLLSIQIVIYCFAVFPISNPPPPFRENSLYSSLSHEGRRSSFSSFFHYSWVLSSCFWFILNKNMYENQAIMKICVYSLDIHIPTFICTGWDSFRRLFFYLNRKYQKLYHWNGCEFLNYKAWKDMHNSWFLICK